MNFNYIAHINFFSEIFDNHNIPLIYKTIIYDDKKTVENKSIYLNKNNVPYIFSLRLIPDYMEPIPRASENYRVKQIKQYNWGYSVLLNEYSCVGEYIDQHFKANFRKVLKRYVKRLEHCFPITYKLYHGKISETEYDFIMGALRDMLVRRFEQKGDKSNDLQNWSHLISKTFEQILNKEASLFVIFNDAQPIEISLNYHFGKILFSAISSYNIDYSKFGLGHIEIYKQLEWCIKNNYSRFEMGVGGMDYKRRWSNSIYQYEHHILYQKTSVLANLIGNLVSLKVVIKEYLKSKKIDRSTFKFKLFRGSRIWEPQYKIGLYLQDFISDRYTKVEIRDFKNSSIKKEIYDFLYLNELPIDSLDIYEIESGRHYILKSSTSTFELKQINN